MSSFTNPLPLVNKAKGRMMACGLVREALCADWFAWNIGFKSSHLVGSKDQVLSALKVQVRFQIMLLINPFLFVFAQKRSLSKPVAPLELTKISSSSLVKVRQAEGQFSDTWPRFHMYNYIHCRPIFVFTICMNTYNLQS